MKQLLLLFTLLLPLSALADRPSAPDGYAWQEVDKLSAAFLVPDGWHYDEVSSGHALLLRITEQQISDTDATELGASIRVYIGNPESAGIMSGIFREAAEEHSVDIKRSAAEPFALLHCKYDSKNANDEPTVRTYMLGLINTLTNTSYLVKFQSPLERWDADWVHGKAILDALALDSGV